ncbi:MAG: translation elongation factor Ts [Candidatus Azobacteroides sp.]|nr:translation elongation factor Ts [Candidatus Azobacteroides sp.]
MAVTMADVTHLRKMTGAGMMDCKNALNEAGGDFDKAMEIIRKKGQAVAAKREDREAAEGCVLAAAENAFAAVVALKCETDFVAKNADFIGLTRKILDLAMEKQPAGKDELCTLVLDGRSVSDWITEKIGVTGEKMELGFYEYIKAPAVVSYIHPGNKLATIVGFNQALDNQTAKDVAMQVAAMNPIALTKDLVPADVIEKELVIAKEKAREEGKPENMVDKIAEGRLNKFYKEVCLLQQEFIKDAKISVDQYLKNHDKNLEVTGFKRVTLNVD